MSEQKPARIESRIQNKCEVPISQDLLDAIGAKDDKARVHLEKRYIVQICSTLNGCDTLFILNGLSAHYGGPEDNADPARVMALIRELNDRGILERNKETGCWRVTLATMARMSEMLGEL